MLACSSPLVFNLQMHVAAAVLFILIGGVLASLNHTRYDWGAAALYRVSYHDLHHRQVAGPCANGQEKTYAHSPHHSLPIRRQSPVGNPFTCGKALRTQTTLHNDKPFACMCHGW